MYYISYVLLSFAIVELNSNVFKFNNKKIFISANAIQIRVDKSWNTPPHLDFLVELVVYIYCAVRCTLRRRNARISGMLNHGDCHYCEQASLLIPI